MVVKIKVSYQSDQGKIIKELSEIKIPILKSYYDCVSHCIDVYIKDYNEYGTLLAFVNNIVYRNSNNSIDIKISRHFTPILDKRYGGK